MRWIVIILALLTIVGCKTKHVAVDSTSEQNDSLRSVVREKDNGVHITSSDILQQHWGERLHTLVLNEKGDTVKEKELVYIENNNISIYRDSISQLKETIDSLVQIKNDATYIRYTVRENLSWYKRMMADYAQYIIGLLLIVLAVVIIYYKVRKRNAYEQEARDIV